MLNYQEEEDIGSIPKIQKRRSSYFEPKYKSTEQMFNIVQQKFFKAEEKINTIIYDTAIEASYDVAFLIKNEIIKKNKEGATFVLGLATGSTPLNVYKKLIEYYENGELSFKNCITFNLDEYYPIEQSSLQSHHRFMKENFFDYIDILPENIHVPDGSLPFSKIDKFCEDYENQIRKLGGIDIQLLGIGATGHIGFNEPGSSFNSTTRMVYLDKVSTIDAAGDFFGVENVPKKAITMGIQTIFQAHKIIVIAFSESKARIVQRAIEGSIDKQIPASFFQKHGKVQFFVDRPASSELARVKCPWTIKGINQQVLFFQKQINQIILPFDDKLKLKAVLWLANKVNKPLSKLKKEDFEQNGLVQLSEQTKNLKQFLETTMKRLTRTFQNYPLGKESQKVLIFSPHPDDDVICMGATMKKFCQQKHDVYVCYQTSGNLGVFDHDAIKFARFASSFSGLLGLKNKEKIDTISSEIAQILKEKRIGEPDHEYIQKIKGMIRKTEATSAALTCGIKSQNIFFLDLPFYQTGKVKKSEIKQIDITKCKELIEQIAPDYIFAAGDLTDPHGTHRNCLLAILKALDQLKNDSAKDYISDLQVYLYRGAWQEWEIEEVDIAIPMTPDDLYDKRLAIFKHQSQKDKALFPGSDFREFWQRSEARNKKTAERYNQLGMIEHEAIEVFANLQSLAHLLKYELN